MDQQHMVRSQMWCEKWQIFFYKYLYKYLRERTNLWHLFELLRVYSQYMCCMNELWDGQLVCKLIIIDCLQLWFSYEACFIMHECVKWCVHFTIKYTVDFKSCTITKSLGESVVQPGKLSWRHPTQPCSVTFTAKAKHDGKWQCCLWQHARNRGDREEGGAEERGSCTVHRTVTYSNI